MKKPLKDRLAPGFLVFRAVDILLDKAQNEHETLYDTNHEISVVKDICYTENPAWKDDCRLDIYRKDYDGRQPVLLYIHGGGFDAGGKQYRRGMATWMAKTGLCVVNVEYGLAPTFKFRDAVKMLTESANWVAAHADEYNFDLGRIMVGGDSSGGWCALYLLALATDPALREELDIDRFNLKFAGAYLNCGMYDLDKLVHLPVVGPIGGILTKDIMGAGKRKFDKHPDRVLCSPINYINADFPKEIFVTYSKYDAICTGQGQNLLKKLDQSSVPYQEYHSTNPIMNHDFMFNWCGGQCAENNKRVFAFLEDFVAKSKT